MGFDRNDSDEGAMKFSEPYENGSYMYADDLKHSVTMIQEENCMSNLKFHHLEKRNIRLEDALLVEDMVFAEIQDITVVVVLVVLHYVETVLNPIM